ncbi:hypothetical protein YC2023_061072 [Brassica napus]
MRNGVAQFFLLSLEETMVSRQFYSEEEVHIWNVHAQGRNKGENCWRIIHIYIYIYIYMLLSLVHNNINTQRF